MINRRNLTDRVLGAVVGSAIADAMGGAFEGAMAGYLRKRTGGDWINGLYDYAGRRGPYGVWPENCPAGVGTDDTRMNHIFIEAVIRNKGHITSQLLAMEYINRYLRPEQFYPEKYADMATNHLEDFYGVSCGWLGMECPLLPGVPVYALRERSFGCRWPTLIGLLSLACAGALYANQPLDAYKKAFELAYFDVGYAKEACALQAAAVSMAVGGVDDIRAILRKVAQMDPFKFDDARFGKSLRSIVQDANRFTRQAKDEKQLSVLLARHLASKHVFDPIDTLTVSFTANRFAEGDPSLAIQIAVNHRFVDQEGRLVRFRDNDCTGYVAGALAGALSGCKKLPQQWVETVLRANKKAYGIDIEKNVHEFCAAVYGAK